MNDDRIVIIGNLVVLSVCAAMMPFMPAGETGDVIGIAAFLTVADVIYLVARVFQSSPS